MSDSESGTGSETPGDVLSLTPRDEDFPWGQMTKGDWEIFCGLAGGSVILNVPEDLKAYWKLVHPFLREKFYRESPTTRPGDTVESIPLGILLFAIAVKLERAVEFLQPILTDKDGQAEAQPVRFSYWGWTAAFENPGDEKSKIIYPPVPKRGMPIGISCGDSEGNAVPVNVKLFSEDFQVAFKFPMDSNHSRGFSCTFCRVCFV